MIQKINFTRVLALVIFLGALCFIVFGTEFTLQSFSLGGELLANTSQEVSEDVSFVVGCQD